MMTWIAEVEYMKTLKGLAIQDIITEVHSFVHRLPRRAEYHFCPAHSFFFRVDFPPKVRIFLLEKLGDIEFAFECCADVLFTVCMQRTHRCGNIGEAAVELSHCRVSGLPSCAWFDFII